MFCIVSLYRHKFQHASKLAVETLWRWHWPSLLIFQHSLHTTLMNPYSPKRALFSSGFRGKVTWSSCAPGHPARSQRYKTFLHECLSMASLSSLAKCLWVRSRHTSVNILVSEELSARAKNLSESRKCFIGVYIDNQ
jgi:hypothetical protein